jgi:AraC-like DNA-binding protein
MKRLLFIKDWIRMGREARYDSVNLARNCLVSPCHLRRFFLTTFYRPPQEWLNELRLWDAMRLLYEEGSVKEVAFTLGFGSVPHFCHRFKEYHGCTPSECFVRLKFSQLNRNEDAGPSELMPWTIAEHHLVSLLSRRTRGHISSNPLLEAWVMLAAGNNARSRQ